MRATVMALAALAAGTPALADTLPETAVAVFVSYCMLTDGRPSLVQAQMPPPPAMMRLPAEDARKRQAGAPGSVGWTVSVPDGDVTMLEDGTGRCIVEVAEAPKAEALDAYDKFVAALPQLRGVTITPGPAETVTRDGVDSTIRTARVEQRGEVRTLRMIAGDKPANGAQHSISYGP